MYYMKMCQHAPYDVNDTIRWIKATGFETAFVVEEKGKCGRVHLQGLLSHKHNSDYIQREKNGLKYKHNEFKNITVVSKYKGEDINIDGGGVFIRYLCKGYEPSKRSPVKIKYIAPLKYILDTKVLELQDKYWEINEELRSNQKLYKKIKSMTISENVKKNLRVTNMDSKKYEEILWYMKIILYYDQEDKLQPSHFQIMKMVKTYMFKEVPQEDKEMYALECARLVFT